MRVAASAQWTPNKPIKVLIPHGAGGAADICIRTPAEKLGPALGQPLILENRAGAGGAIGTEAGARAPADGYSLVVGSDAAFSIIPHLQKTPYDPVKDFEPVALMATVPLVLVVHPSLQVKAVQDIVDVAKSKPGQLTIAANGNGSSGHLSAELFKSVAKINLLHVPYRAMGPVMADVLGGPVMMTFSSLGPVEQHIKSGKLRAIAISAPKRFAGMPDVPTMAGRGSDITPLIGPAVAAGGDVRAGLEDAPLHSPLCNVELVRRAAASIRAAGGRVATAAGVRAEFGAAKIAQVAP